MKQINVTRSSMPSFDEYIEEIKDIWETRWLTNNGVKHQFLEKFFFLAVFAVFINPFANLRWAFYGKI